MSQFNSNTNVNSPNYPSSFSGFMGGNEPLIQQTPSHVPQMAPMWNSDGKAVTALSPEHTLMPFANVSDAPVPQFQNGRVIGLSEVKGGNQFQMFTENNNNCNNAKDTILYGTQVRTPLSDAFFSKANMQCLQDGLRYRVFTASGGKYQIGEQDNTNLQIIMRAIYLLHGKFLDNRIREQITELNRHVIEYILPNLLSEVKQWIHFSDQIQQLPSLIDLPKNLSSKGTRTLASVTNTF